MSITMEFDGLQDLIKSVEKIANEEEINEATKKALKKIIPVAEVESKRNYPRSDNPNKSGRKGSRTGQHSVDNIQSKIKKEKGKYVAVIGWEKGDTSPYFYNKFLEWGTSKMPPRHMFFNTYKKQKVQYDDIFQEEFERLLKELEEV